MRTVSTNVSIKEPLTLGDLRWLVEHCVGMPDSTRVSTKEHKSYNAREWDQAEITVHGTDSQ
jgi:hypothetical protein